MSYQNKSIEDIAYNLEKAQQYLLSEMGKQDKNTEAMEHLIILTQDYSDLIGMLENADAEIEDANRDIRMLEEDKANLEYDLKWAKEEIRELK